MFIMFYIRLGRLNLYHICTTLFYYVVLNIENKDIIQKHLTLNYLIFKAFKIKVLKRQVIYQYNILNMLIYNGLRGLCDADVVSLIEKEIFHNLYLFECEFYCLVDIR